MARYIILDTETTGADEKDRIIQLGYMVLGGTQIEVQNDFCSSEVPISYGAMEVHNITPDIIEGKPTCAQTQAYKRLLELNTPENYMIIHNAPFDIGMLEKEGLLIRFAVHVIFMPMKRRIACSIFAIKWDFIKLSKLKRVS